MKRLLNKIATLFVLNKLSLNKVKTVFITFGNYADSVQHNIVIIDIMKLKSKESIRY